METKDDVIFFESDEEFEDFCIAPFATIENSEEGGPFIKGDFSEQYMKALKDGKAFVIKSNDSYVCRRKIVTKRVPVIMEGIRNRTVCIQLDDVQNVMDYHTWKFFGRDLL